MEKRLLQNAALIASILFLPWWVSLLASVIFLFNIENYYEIIGAGFLLDVLYGAPTAGFYGLEFAMTLSASLIFLISGPLKRRLIFYAH